MNGTIVLPLDGSELAETAMPWAVALARATSARLLLLRVQMPYVTGVLGPVPALAVDLHDHELDSARAYLEKFARLTQLDCKIEVALGFPMEEIVRVSERAELIVMASHGRTGPARWLLGSVAEGVLHHATCPVLLVRTGASGRPGVQGFRRVLVPTDGSADSVAVLERIQGYLAPGAEVILLRAVDRELRETTLYYEPGFHRHYFSQLEEELRHADPGRRASHRILDRDPADAILDEAQETGADLIAMATHGRTGFRRLLLGSVTEKVCRHASCGVLVFPPRASVEGLIGEPIEREVFQNAPNH